MRIDEAITALEGAPLYFEPRTAAAYVNARGRCEYCGRELIDDRLAYACAQIDHLLPQGNFPYEITGKKENFVLSCLLCNGTKRDKCVLEDGEDPLAMLSFHRAALIQRAGKLIQSRQQNADEQWNRVKAIFSRLGRVESQLSVQADGPAGGGSPT